MTKVLRLCAIHQPNFFPWLGFFDKVRQADTFVFLNAVAYPRSGSKSMGSWTNRVRINVQGQPHWVGCPVLRQPLGAPILSVQIDGSQPWQSKLMKTLEANYRRAANFAAGMALIEPLIRNAEGCLAEYNRFSIVTIAEHLGLNCRFLLQSELDASGAGTDLLIDLTRHTGCDGYLAGGGAGGYQQDHLFSAAGVKLVYQNFQPRTYGPPDRFIPGLSVIDYLLLDGRPLTEAFPE